MLRPLAVIVILLVAVGGDLSQTVNDQALVNASGWGIDALLVLKMKSQSEMRFGTAKVCAAALLVPEEGILFEDTAYYLEVNGRRTLHASPMNAYFASRFDVNGHVFAYTVRGPGVAIAQVSKTETRVGALGCESFFAFYDNVGRQIRNVGSA